MAQLPQTCHSGASLSSKVRPPSIKTMQPIRSQHPAWQWRWKQLLMLDCPQKNCCGCTAQDILEWREITEQTDCQAKQPSQVACISEDLTCWGAWDATCWHKAEDTTPVFTWRREAWKEEVLDFLERMGEGWSTYGLFQAHRCHLILNWTCHTFCCVNWNILNCI